MDAQDIYIIRQIFESGSVTKTAASLFISPQALSKRIQRIENELDTVLFKRTPSGMIPTEECKRFYKSSKPLYNELTEFVESFRSHIYTDKVKLSVAASLGVLALITPEKIHQFRTDNPDIELLIREYPDKQVDDLVGSGTVNMGLAIAPVNLKHFTVVPLAQLPFCVLVSRDSYMADKNVIRFEDLQNVPLAVENRDFKVYDIIHSSCRNHGFTPDIYCETLELQLAHSLAREDRCAAVSVLCDRFLHGTDGLDIKQFRNPVYWEILAIRKTGETFNNAERRFLEFAENELAEGINY